jgi:hypothetical protein
MPEHLPSGLTAEQKQIVKASSGPKLGDLSLNEFKHALVRPLVTSGIKGLPSEVETQLLYEQIGKYYKHITLGEFYLAFELNSLGQSWTRVEHFNLFNLAYISDVINRYLESKGKAVIQTQKLTAQQVPPAPDNMSDIERKQILKSILVEDEKKVKAIATGSALFLGTLVRITINKLYIHGALSDDDFNAETWTKYQAQAKKIAKEDAIKNGYYRYNKERYRDTYKVELARLLYIDMLTNNELFTRVISRL